MCRVLMVLVPCLQQMVAIYRLVKTRVSGTVTGAKKSVMIEIIRAVELIMTLLWWVAKVLTTVTITRMVVI